MNSPTILACENPDFSCCQLGALAAVEGKFVLLGWEGFADNIDGCGVPKKVGQVLARTLTSISNVTFPMSEHGLKNEKHPSAADAVTRSLHCHGMIERIGAAFRGEPCRITLVSTQDAAIANHLFEDSSFPWWLQGQVVLLSQRDGPPPTIDRKTLLSLMDHDWANRVGRLSVTGIIGALRPGVDGDVATIMSLTDNFTQILLNVLAREARVLNIDFAMVSEASFADRLARDGASCV
jgi:hypothetical protein